MTVSLTTQNYVMEQIEALGSNMVLANYEYDPQRPSALSNDINLSDLEAVKANIPEVAEVAGTRQMNVTLQLDGNELPANLVGVTERFRLIRKLVILQGRYFDEGDISARRKVCLITASLAERISPGEDAVGKSVRIGELQFDIIGVFTERVPSLSMNEIHRESVLVPFDQMKYLTGEDKIWLLYAQARTPEDVLPVTQSLYQLLKSRHPGSAAYRVQNLDPVLKVANRVSFALKIVMLIIALIAMVSSGVGIMNIMLTSVVERTQEIGIRRAFGARRVHILRQFLLEALVINVIGALAGIAAGLTVPMLVQPMFHGSLRLQSSWLSPFLALLVSCVFGLFFGYLPASRAAGVEPYESLRHE